MEAAAVPEEFRRLDEEVRKILDASRNEMYSLAFAVGMPS